MKRKRHGKNEAKSACAVKLKPKLQSPSHCGRQRLIKAETTVGPGFSPRTVINDEWQTCKESWQDVSRLLVAFRSQRIWQPFYYDGKCGQYLKELGFKKVVHTESGVCVRVRIVVCVLPLCHQVPGHGFRFLFQSQGHQISEISRFDLG